MPNWILALNKTTLIFWEDENPLTWAQVIVLFLSTSVFYVLARLPFAGGKEIVDLSSIVIIIQILVALILVITAGRLGTLETWAPNFVRLLTVHLIFVMVVLSTNHLYQWADYIQTNFLLTTLASLVSTLLLSWYTLLRSTIGNRLFRRWSFYGSAIFITVASGLITYHSVIPKAF